MICVMYDGKDKNTDSQTNNSNKYIYQTHMAVCCKMKTIATR